VGETTTFNASEGISYYPYSGYNITTYTWILGDGTGSHGEGEKHDRANHGLVVKEVEKVSSVVHIR